MENRISVIRGGPTAGGDSDTVIVGKAKHISYRLDSIIAFSGGDSESFRQIMNSLIRSCKMNVKLFRVCLHKKDDDGISELSHKMLTLFRHLEAFEIVEPLALLAEKKSVFTGSQYYYRLGRSVLEMIETLIQAIQKNGLSTDCTVEMP